MYALTYHTPTGNRTAAFDKEPRSTELMEAALKLRQEARLPALLKPPVKPEAN